MCEELVNMKESCKMEKVLLKKGEVIEGGWMEEVYIIESEGTICEKYVFYSIRIKGKDKEEKKLKLK